MALPPPSPPPPAPNHIHTHTHYHPMCGICGLGGTRCMAMKHDRSTPLQHIPHTALGPGVFSLFNHTCTLFLIFFSGQP
jgi:hypothetical protein